MENGFQVTKFLFEVQKTSNLFCLVQYGPVVIWVACIGLRGSYRWSWRSERAFSEAFWTFSPVSLVYYTGVSVAQQTVGLLQWKMVFKSPNFYLKSKRLQTFFASSKMAKLSFGLPILALEGVLGDPKEVKGPFQRPFGPSVQKALKSTFHFLRIT